MDFPAMMTRSVRSAPLHQRVHRRGRREYSRRAFGTALVASSRCRAVCRAKEKEVSWDAQLLLGALRLYRQCLSPLLPPNCRYAPSCSRYGIEAVTRYGAFQGFVLFVWRLIRCTPLAPGHLAARFTDLQVPIDRSKLVWAYGRWRAEQL